MTTCSRKNPILLQVLFEGDDFLRGRSGNGHDYLQPQDHFVGVTLLRVHELPAVGQVD